MSENIKLWTKSNYDLQHRRLSIGLTQYSDHVIPDLNTKICNSNELHVRLYTRSVCECQQFLQARQFYLGFGCWISDWIQTKAD